MLTTSVSLPENEAVLWRKRQRSILRLAVRSLRVQLRGKAVRRGVKRSYNRVPGEFLVVTTRFTEAEYDTLHMAAASMRVSVSWLVYQLILLWKKPARRNRPNAHVTNYELHLCIWSPNAAILTESLLFYPKIAAPDAHTQPVYLSTP
ncbi:hypothetical protein Turpa_3819 [Turneriella parva DSM 21527]|uniref:Uncharacterized protein n=1 Tax=Turneriella parva (strain ATCC BAA-1111 / DSM 21527 / NCTC 11395 / H) TaxID=869212 RepID=I4BAZ6_TURPD|nr:hypothetical protein Turpa_3819 [Turneriella parva DSM 21527]